MTDKVDIWMPLYVRDYLGATSRLTTEQHGAYMLLIMDYWLNGPPPDDDAVLASIARLSLEHWSKHRASIERLFTVHGGEWRHRRIDREIELARDRKKQAVERGKRGARARWRKENGHSNRASIEQASDKQWTGDGSSPSSSPTPPQSQSTSKEKEPNGSSPDVDESTPEAKYTIPLTGGKSHPVTQDDIDRYRELFPSIDVEQSIRAMLAWIDSNPQKRSGSPRGAKTRMTSWLTRDQDKASRQPRPNGTRPPIADQYANKTYEGTPDDELPASLR